MTKVFQITKRCYQHIKINYNKYLLGAFGLLLTVQAFADDYDGYLSGNPCQRGHFPLA